MVRFLRLGDVHIPSLLDFSSNNISKFNSHPNIHTIIYHDVNLIIVKFVIWPMICRLQSAEGGLYMPQLVITVRGEQMTRGRHNVVGSKKRFNNVEDMYKLN